jgi:hypothetical protein
MPVRQDVPAADLQRSERMLLIASVRTADRGISSASTISLRRSPTCARSLPEPKALRDSRLQIHEDDAAQDWTAISVGALEFVQMCTVRF